MTPSHSFKVTITPDVVREASRGFVWRYFGWTGVACLIGGALLITGFHILGSFGWLANLLAAALLVFVTVFGLALWQRERLALRKLAAMTDPLVHFDLSDEKFSARSQLGQTSVPWSTIKGLWRLPHCWLLFFDRATYVTLPLDGPTQDDLDFIAGKIPRHDKSIPAK